MRKRQRLRVLSFTEERLHFEGLVSVSQLTSKITALFELVMESSLMRER